MRYKLCAKVGCHNLVAINITYCKDHEHIIKERYKQYRRLRTDKKEQAFYNSKAWKLTREFILDRDKGLCLCCYKDELIKLADTVHHIDELKEAWHVRLDDMNLLSVCDKCHKRIHAIYKTKNKKAMQEILRKLVIEVVEGRGG